MGLQDVAGATVRPDGSIEWKPGFGPSGYGEINDAQTKQNTQYLSGLPGGDQQANRWQAFGLTGKPEDPQGFATRTSGAPPGSPAWKQAFRSQFVKEQDWATAMAQHGASASDLGWSPTVGHGLANFSRWGEIQDYANREAQKGNWLDPNRGLNMPAGQGGINAGQPQGGAQPAAGGFGAINTGGIGTGVGGGPIMPTVGDPNAGGNPVSAPVLDAFGRPRRGTRTGLQGLALGTHNAFDPVPTNG